MLNYLSHPSQTSSHGRLQASTTRLHKVSYQTQYVLAVPALFPGKDSGGIFTRKGRHGEDARYPWEESTYPPRLAKLQKEDK